MSALLSRFAPDADLDAFEKQVAAQGVKTERKKDPEPSVTDVVTFADPKGTIMQVFKRDAFAHQKFTRKGIVPHKLGHVAFHVTDVKHVTKFYCDVLGFRESDWMGGFLLVPALRSRPSHHQPDGDRLEPPFPHRLRAARLGAHARCLRLPQSQRLQAAVGAGPARHRPQSVRLSSLAERPDHRNVC